MRLESFVRASSFCLFGFLAGLLATFWFVQPCAAQTKGFAIDRLDVSERGSDWFVGESLDIRGHGRGALGILGEYGYKPLVLYDLNGNERSVIIQHQLYLHVG